MNRALKELNAQTWFAGLRREQSGSRAHLPVLAIQRGVFKVLPIIDWDNRTVYQYLQKHGLKYHPLWDQGYLSVGDTHTTANGSRVWRKKRRDSLVEARVRAARRVIVSSAPENRGKYFWCLFI
ncbi:phosphoadenosine phosphosulfate reductase [Citrobacter freundii]|nr:phosphoadenosine phosphosulfate reductase [Citrobacter freundii]